MAVAPRAPGDYAPLAGGRAVEALQDAAAPLRGVARPACQRRRGSRAGPRAARWRAAARRRCRPGVEWRVLFADPELRRVGMALEHGLRGGESAISPEDWEAWIDATERIGRSLNGTADLVVLHDPGTLGLAAGLDVPVTWRCHLDASRAEGEALALVTNLLDPAGSRSCRTSPSPPTRSATIASRPLRPASTRSTRATWTSSRASRAAWCARSALISIGRSSCRSCSSTAGTTPTPRSRPSASPRPRSPSSSSCSPACSTRAPPRTGAPPRRCRTTRRARPTCSC